MQGLVWVSGVKYTHKMVYLLPVLYLYEHVVGYLKPKHSEQDKFLDHIWL